MSSSTSRGSSNKSPPSTTHTSPDGTTSCAGSTTNKKEGGSKLPAITFQKRTSYIKTSGNQPSAFSSYSPSDTESTPADANSSTTSPTNTKHYHGELGTSCDCNSPPFEATTLASNKIQTPASSSKTTSKQSSSVEIGAQFPFTNNNSKVRYEDQEPLEYGDPRTAYMMRSQSSSTLLSDGATTSKKASNYKPAKHIIKSNRTSPQSSLSQQQHHQSTMRNKPQGLVFTSEEQAREAAILRNNYSLPPSPTSGVYTPFPRQLREPKTPLYVPAVLRRATSSDAVDKQNQSGDKVSFGQKQQQQQQQQKLSQQQQTPDSYFPKFSFAVPTGPPSRSHWKPDNLRNACAQCNRLFTLFERRHHCRRCGDIYCGFHSRFTVYLDQNVSFNPVMGTPSRACLGCSIEFEEFKKSYLHPPNMPSSSSSSSSAFKNPLQHDGTPISAQPVSVAAVRDSPMSVNGGADRANQPIGSIQNSVPADWQWSTF